MCINNTTKIRDKITGENYECFPQMIELDYDNKYYLRYNIGINGWQGWTNVCCVYDNNEFNERYEVIK